MEFLLHNFHELFIIPFMQCESFCRLQILIFHVSSEVSQKIPEELNLLNRAHVHGEFAKRNICVSGIFDTGYTFQEELKSFFFKINNSFAGSNYQGRKWTQFASLLKSYSNLKRDKYKVCRQPGWKKLCRKIWTRTKISSPNLPYLHTFWNLWAKEVL